MNIKDQIKQILKDNIYELSNIELEEELGLISTGYLESFDIINLISIFEDKFNININLDNVELEDFNTINSMNKLVEKFIAMENKNEY